MNSINNFNNYLLGNKYNKDTIKEDINTCLDLLLNNDNTYNLNTIRKSLSNYLDRYALDSLNFIRFIENNNYDNPIVYNIYEKYNLPFIHSDNPLMDQLILSKLFNKDNISLGNVIFCLACFIDKSYINKIELKHMLDNSLSMDDIDFMYIGKYPMMGLRSKYCDSEEEMIDNMESLRGNMTLKNPHNVVGQYSELVVYNYLKEGLSNKQDIKWISRDIGDGFGFDIAVINEDNSASLYEVKGLFNSNSADISGHEHRLLNESLKRDDLDYHIMLVLPKLNDTIVDITKDINNNIHYEFIGHKVDTQLLDKDRRVMVRNPVI